MPAPVPESIDAHRQTLSRMSAAGGPLRADAATATINNPQWFTMVGGVPRPRAARNQLHRTILEEHRAATPNVAADKKAIILAGPPGAGKSTVLPAVVRRSGIPVDQWRVIDADYFKDRLLEQAIADKSLWSAIAPADVRSRMAADERFYPLELASLVHEESSLLARAARSDAITAGENVVIDTVLSDPSTALSIGAQLRAAGYQLTVVEVEVERDESIARTQTRWRDGYVAAEAGTGAPLGGRWVPEELPASLYAAGHTDSRCRAAASGLAREQGAVVRYEEHRVDPTGAPALEAQYRRPGVDQKLERVSAAAVSYPTPPDAALNARRGRTDPGRRGAGNDLSR